MYVCVCRSVCVSLLLCACVCVCVRHALLPNRITPFSPLHVPVDHPGPGAVGDGGDGPGGVGANSCVHVCV